MIQAIQYVARLALLGTFAFGSTAYAADEIVDALLHGEQAFKWALPFEAFAAPGKAEAPVQPLTGRLHLDVTALAGGFQTVLDRDGIAAAPANRVRELPPFDFTFYEVGGAIVPVKRGIAKTDHPSFDWILSPGRAWSTGTGTRLSIPFALMEKNANCLHNGALLVDIGADGKASNALVQIGSETCAYFKYNFWASYKASWQPQRLANLAALQAGYKAELAARLPVKPIAGLAAKHPDVDAKAFAQASLIPPSEMSSYGIVYDGTLYAGDCATRLGPYPHCASLVLPSYSLAKSLAGGLGLMRLEALYPGAFKAKVSDYIPQCAIKRWRGVTFGDLLNMTTGNYGTSKPHMDEGSADYMPFFDAATSADKTAFACTHFKHRSKPGKKWVYHTSDTYLLGVAMNAYLHARTGERADFYRDLLTPMWHRLGLSPLMDIMRTTAGDKPENFTGYGMAFNRDDIARTAQWLASDGRGLRDLFAPHALDAALQKAPEDRGLRAGADTLRYKNGFWAWNAKKALGCRKDTWLPFLSGYGGISVVMLPNGAAYYYVSDTNVFAYATPLRELAEFMPICKESHD